MRRRGHSLDDLLRLPNVHARHGRAYVRITYRDGDKWRSRERLVRTPEEAIRAAAELRGESEGARRVVDAARMTMADLLAEYVTAYPKAKKWYLAPIEEYFRDWLIRSITYADCLRFKEARLATPCRFEYLKRTRSTATIHRELEHLRAVLLYAERHSWIDRSPFSAGPPLIRKSEEATRSRLPSPEEEARLLAACVEPRAHLRALVLAARDTGLRRSALLELRWADVDWARSLIRVPRPRSHHKSRPPFVGMTARLAGELRAKWESLPVQDETATIFQDVGDFKRAWATACRLAGVEDLRFHDLRHGYVTDLLEAEVGRRLAMKAAGHSTEAMHGRYENLDERLARQVADALDKLHEARGEKLDKE